MHISHQWFFRDFDQFQPLKRALHTVGILTRRQIKANVKRPALPYHIMRFLVYSISNPLPIMLLLMLAHTKLSSFRDFTYSLIAINSCWCSLLYLKNAQKKTGSAIKISSNCTLAPVSRLSTVASPPNPFLHCCSPCQSNYLAFLRLILYNLLFFPPRYNQWKQHGFSDRHYILQLPLRYRFCCHIIHISSGRQWETN